MTNTEAIQTIRELNEIVNMCQEMAYSTMTQAGDTIRSIAYVGKIEQIARQVLAALDSLVVEPSEDARKTGERISTIFGVSRPQVGGDPGNDPALDYVAALITARDERIRRQCADITKIRQGVLQVTLKDSWTNEEIAQSVYAAIMGRKE